LLAGWLAALPLLAAGPAPTITSVSPPGGSTLGGTVITITGNNFTSPATVKVGGVAATNVIATLTQITATTPAHAAGAVDVAVTNLDSQSATLAAAFTYQLVPQFKFSHWAVGKLASGNGYDVADTSMPDIVQLPDKTYRMYYTANINPPLPSGARLGIKSATSADGLTWTVESGYRLVSDGDGDGGPDGIPANEGIIDGPRVVRLSDGRFRMYYQPCTSPILNPVDFRVKSAISNDGLTFTREGGTVIDCAAYPAGAPGQFALAAHCAVIRFSDADYVMLVSGNYSKAANLPSDLVYATSTDGRNFGNFSILYTGGHDPVVVKLAAGGYKLIYGDYLNRQRLAYSADGKTWPAASQTSEIICFKSDGATEVTENTPPDTIQDRTAFETSSGEIVIILPWGNAGPSLAVLRQIMPAQITSALTATGTTGTAFGYTITASGATPISYSAEPLPAGLSLNGAVISGTPTQAGSYAVTLTATNASGSDSKTLVITVNQLTTISDSDGDGFPDELETALGTNPADATSTPFGGAAAGTPLDLVIGKMQIKLDFAKANNDRINIQGTLPVADGFSFADKVVVFDVGGAIKSFTLNEKGNSPSGANDSVKINKPKGGVAKYIVKFNKGSFAANLADEGLVGTADAKSASKEVTVVVLFNSTLLRTTKTMSYTAKANKNGLAK
jgi:hypothetical protein